jgi:hypothetical protein
MPYPEAERPNTTEWVDLGPPGYFGAYRDARFAEFDARYGEGNWEIVWKDGDGYLSFEEAVIQHYERSYDVFLDEHPDILDRLAGFADVYDDAETNVGSGLDYAIQETAHTHIQDIAIRRCMNKRGRIFEGEELVQIRDEVGTHELSMTLSPGRVPFHDPSLIRERAEADPGMWWEVGSVEDWYQANKTLRVRKS